MLMEHDRGSKDKINESSTVSYLRPLPEGGCLKKAKLALKNLFGLSLLGYRRNMAIIC